MLRRPRSPHPAISTARNELTRLIHDYEGALVAAVSGGSDSMSLALVTQYVAEHTGRDYVCVIVDHGLRPDSEAEALTVAGRLASLGMPDIRIARVDATGEGGPEAAARTARYDALADVAREVGGMVVLGHTADDQAETVLLGLARGSGTRSIAGMADVAVVPGNDDILALRPLLGVRRAGLREALAGMSVEWVDDPTNEVETDFRAADGTLLRRSAIRHQGIPGLNQALRMSVVEPLARTAMLVRRDNEALDMWADENFGRFALWDDVAGSVSFVIADIAELPIAVRTRVLRRAAIEVGARPGALTVWHIDHMDDLVTGEGRVRGHRSIDLPGGDGYRVKARQDAGVLRIERA